MSSSTDRKSFQDQLQAAQKTVAALMERVEQSTNAAGDLQALLENNYALQREIQLRRIEERELKTFNRALEARVQERTKELDRVNNSLKQKNKLLQEMSVRDGLTGLHNRRHLSTSLSREYHRAKRYGTDFSILMFDLDFFKKVNDNHGHEFGDFVLQDFSERLLNLTRKSDIVCRFGGEEFVVIMPETNLQGAVIIAEKIRVYCENTPFTDDNHQRKVTLSCGITSLHAYPVEKSNELLKIADKALYLAKGQGRNNVQILSYENDHYDIENQNIESLKDEILRILTKTKQSSVSAIQLLASNYGNNCYSDYLKALLRYLDLLGKRLHLPPSVLNIFENTAILYYSTNCLLDEEEATISFDELLTRFDLFSKERHIFRCLNERYDGKGFPVGLQGDEIPDGARIFSVANQLAKLSFGKSSDNQQSPKKILEEMAVLGSHDLDPEIVQIMFDLIEQHSLLKVSKEDIAGAKAQIGS